MRRTGNRGWGPGMRGERAEFRKNPVKKRVFHFGGEIEALKILIRNETTEKGSEVQ
jgi:hypothetical protein